MVTLVYGRSGSGKSRSMKNLDRKEVLLINVQGKQLPFKGKFEKTFIPVAEENGSMVDKILCVIKKTIAKYPEVKVIVIDDAGYLMTNTFMAQHTKKAGSAQFDLYNLIADDFWKLINECNKLPAHVNTYIMMHEQMNDYGEVRLRTIGKLLDDKVCLEGLVTVSLRCMTDGKNHWFETQNTGNDVSKSPEEMFPSSRIENDLKAVDTAIREYYGQEGANENV